MDGGTRRKYVIYLLEQTENLPLSDAKIIYIWVTLYLFIYLFVCLFVCLFIRIPISYCNATAILPGVPNNFTLDMCDHALQQSHI